MGEGSLKELRAAFRALADETRLRMLAELAGHGEIAVSELARAVRLSQPLVSWHLAILRRAALVRNRREGRQVYCSLDHAGLDRCRAALDLLAHGGLPGRAGFAVVLPAEPPGASPSPDSQDAGVPVRADAAPARGNDAAKPTKE